MINLKSWDLIKHPCVFQGEDKLKSNKNYFEGWYFKNVTDTDTICFIPGIHIENGNSFCFIQVVINQESYYFSFPIEEFIFCQKPFLIQIGQNIFSETGIEIHLKDKNFLLEGSLFYQNNILLNKTSFSPNIMGPFTFLPFMECNHAILQMKNCITGNFLLNGKSYSFLNGTGYIEKDWGSSFPKDYLWAQGNCFQNSSYDTSFFLSIAHIPFSLFSFQGFICVFRYQEKEYRFTTYNHSCLREFSMEENKISIVLTHLDLTLAIMIEKQNDFPLIAPKNGQMKLKIKESIDSIISLQLRKGNQIVFEDSSSHCGLEIVDPNSTLFFHY